MNASVRSARKYAVHASSPLAKDSTNMVTPVRSSRRKDSFSANMHGVGGEAKEAMLRSGLRVKRTHSLRMVATKGNATLTAMFHNFPTPDLDLFRKLYQRMEPEFAEQIPSAVCPFQFVPNDSSDMNRWRSKSSDDGQDTPDPEIDDSQMNAWLKDMRSKVHNRLSQKQQIENVSNPIETQPQLQLGGKKDKEDAKKPLSPKNSFRDPKKKSEKLKLELALDNLGPPSSSPRSHSARSFSKPRLSPKNSSRVAPAPSPNSSPPSSPNKKAKHDKRLPPLQPRSPSSIPSSASASPISPGSSGKPRLPKIYSHDSSSMMDAGGPLFYPRNDPIYGRRTYSELDVRRVQAKARNSIGMEQAS